MSPIGPATPRVAEPRAPMPGTGRHRAQSGAATLVLHGLFAVLFVLAWQSMVRPIVATDATPVELVSEVPGETKAAPAKEPEPAPSRPPSPSPPPPPPAAAADAPAPTPPPIPAPPLPPDPPPPSALDKAIPSPLVEPPPEPKAAAAQSQTNQTGHAGTDTDKHDAPSPGATTAPADTKDVQKPVAAPEVLTTDKAGTSVPAPGTASASEKPVARGDPTPSAVATAAQLSAALATESLPMPLSFRAALSARGVSSDANYRGSVFGAINRARQAVNEEAQAKRLKGQVIIAIVLTDTGAIAQVTIVQSSGSTAADAFALAMVRRAAPFPPPPPGASHTFTPAISFGDG